MSGLVASSKLDRPAATPTSQGVEPSPPASTLAPLLPVALAVTAGILVDRYTGISLSWMVIGITTAVLASAIGWARGQARLSLFLLWMIAFFLGALWHHVRQVPYSDDIGHFAKDESQLAQLRGVVLDDPVHQSTRDDPLRSRPNQERSAFILQVTDVRRDQAWMDARGRVKVWVGNKLAGARAGDEVEVTAELQSVPAPSNPGEADLRIASRDQGIRAHAYVKTADAVSVQRRASNWSVQAWLAQLRGWASDTLRVQLSERRAGVAAALLLGEQKALEPDDLQGYLRTGVFHVLAISGQHLVILCAALWPVLRLMGVRRRTAAVVMSLFVIGYSLLTGAQPPILRAMAVVCAACGALFLHRRAQPVNSLALAWLFIILLNPASILQTGCQLSFLAVAVLSQVMAPWHQWATAERDNLTVLVEQTRPHWQRLLLQIGAWFWWSLLASLVVWLACAPLLATRFHLVSPVAVLLSPFMIMLTTVALIGGFLLLLVSSISPTLASPLAWVVDLSLQGCEALIRMGEQLPAGYWYSRGLPEWWLWLFYLCLLMVLLLPTLRRVWKAGLALLLIWLIAGLIAIQFQPPPSAELRCTFLAVGHGACAVIETPDGRVFLYDAGSMAGPQVTAWQIAPFLWSRGITRIDEVFLSHADLDHFNGLPDLLDRFEVSRVSLTPSFKDKPSPGVERIQQWLERHRISTQVLHAGQQLRAGDLVIDVLHPPLKGPDGEENARSLVLLLRHRDRTILLTGDLEPPGLNQVIRPREPEADPLPFPPPGRGKQGGVDVLLAPHHGSGSSNTEAFARWARPGLVISSEGRPSGPRPDPYAKYGAAVWRTWPDGAATIRIDGAGLRAETFKTGKEWRR